ncbi:glycoside hydrolase 5 family protein [Pseudoduganella sp. RAF53_2]|uniref:glycoside hydrolase 5 family protein n=1 Tax=unclassified Pseudoduganella TaxID=2637179 RepID=UPI003F97B382
MNKMLAALACLLALNAAAADFVKVRGTHFERDGQAYYIAGANLWYGGYLGAAGKPGDRARLGKELDALKALGINNLRVLAVSEKTVMPSAVRPATTSAPGQYDEALLQGLDFLLAEMARRDMTAVLYLNNFWQWSGGMTQYLNWFEGTPAIDPNVTKDYEGFMSATARFYRSPQAQDEYRRVIRSIVQRKNTVTGKSYAADATIMAWQLANEPRPGGSKPGAAERDAYVQWIDDTAKYIHSLDSSHLVSTGSEGVVGASRDPALFERAHRSPQVDYLTYHLWPKNWGWTTSWDNAWSLSRAYLNAHIDAAAKLGKPIVLEEFGWGRDGGAFDRRSGTEGRDRFYREVLDLVATRAAQGDPIAGFNFWAWSGAGRAANPDYWWKEGNDFLGDPPQEEQGLYSVFDSDQGTLDVIRLYAGKLRLMR